MAKRVWPVQSLSGEAERGVTSFVRALVVLSLVTRCTSSSVLRLQEEQMKTMKMGYKFAVIRGNTRDKIMCAECAKVRLSDDPAVMRNQQKTSQKKKDPTTVAGGVPP